MVGRLSVVRRPFNASRVEWWLLGEDRPKTVMTTQTDIQVHRQIDDRYRVHSYTDRRKTDDSYADRDTEADDRRRRRRRKRKKEKNITARTASRVSQRLKKTGRTERDAEKSVPVAVHGQPSASLSLPLPSCPPPRSSRRDSDDSVSIGVPVSKCPDSSGVLARVCRGCSAGGGGGWELRCD
ncbi:hypothetical protein LY78DRAFT_654897 [Colletotrichum sublineola]|nr:hypothetical protein LY78DRAFT_654897 [Colletotrichum sublineola]